MNDIAAVTLSEEQAPANLESLKSILIGNGLDGEYSISGEFLSLKNEEGAFEFNLYEAYNDEFGESGPGIDIAGHFIDEVATIIDLKEIVEIAFPGSNFSSAYD